MHASSSRPTRDSSACAICRFIACEGFYSKAAEACTWPCSITQMDPADQMDQVYEGIVHWADVILVSTPDQMGRRQQSLLQNGRTHELHSEPGDDREPTPPERIKSRRLSLWADRTMYRPSRAN